VPAAAVRPYQAIVLAGGRSARARSDKLRWTREGRTLLAHAVAAVPDAQHIVLVGPHDPALAVRGLIWCRESPPFAGPVAAIAAGLGALTDQARTPPATTLQEGPPVIGAPEAVTVLLAGDLPAAGPAVPALLAALTGDRDAVVLVDEQGVRQPLLAAYRTTWLRARVGAARPGASVRSLLGTGRVHELTDIWSAAADVDTELRGEALGFQRSTSAPTSAQHQP
jgi:molybdopterin-guanine dinucleotide biosynthesis protein A